MEREARMKEEYGKFLAQMEEFIFAEKKPEKADIIFVPGNGYPQMAEKAAQLYRQGLAALCPAKRQIQCCDRKVFGCTGERGCL